MEVEMNRRIFREVAPVALAISLTAILALSQTPVPPSAVASPPGQETGGGSGNGGAEPCTHSPICAWGAGRNLIGHEERTPDMGFTFVYPFALPEGLTGGVAAVAVNSKDHLYAFQRNP